MLEAAGLRRIQAICHPELIEGSLALPFLAALAKI